MKLYYYSNGNIELSQNVIEEKENELNYIEIDDTSYNDLFSCEWGKKYIVKNKKVELVEDKNITSIDEYKSWLIEQQIQDCQNYLTRTDYVISKLSELKLEDEDTYNKELEKYKEVLEKRKECRTKINALQ